MQFSSHMFLLRRKIPDEIFDEKGKYGTHILKNLKPRHLGRDERRALDLVECPDGSMTENCINFNIQNFNVTEVGDLIDYYSDLNGHNINVDKGDKKNVLPKVFQ